MKTKVFSMFSGVAGIDMGIERALGKDNVEIVGFSEIDKYASMVLKYNYPEVKNYGDAKKNE